MTINSSEELRAQAERAKKQKGGEKAASSGGAESLSDKDPELEDGAKKSIPFSIFVCH